MTTREDYLDRGATALAIAVERSNELIASGRAEQAAREAGARTNAEVATWVAKYAAAHTPEVVKAS